MTPLGCEANHVSAVGTSSRHLRDRRLPPCATSRPPSKLSFAIRADLYVAQYNLIQHTGR